jgi:hypothetical protein
VRRDWLEQRMLLLAQYFAVAIDAFAIMSNRFHWVVSFDPQESYRWRDEEVAECWLRVFPPGTCDMSESDQVALLGLHSELLLPIRPIVKIGVQDISLKVGSILAHCLTRMQ